MAQGRPDDVATDLGGVAMALGVIGRFERPLTTPLLADGSRQVASLAIAGAILGARR